MAKSMCYCVYVGAGLVKIVICINKSTYVVKEKEKKVPKLHLFIEGTFNTKSQLIFIYGSIILTIFAI